MEAQDRTDKVSFAKGIGVGVIASLVGTAMMDLVIVAQFLMMGQPALTYLDLIGSIFGDGISVGAPVHIALGSLLGVAFAVPVLTIDALRIDSIRKGIVLGFLFGLASIVACVPFALLIGEKITTVLRFMIVPHLVWGLGLGIVAGYGMRSAPATTAR